MSMNKELKVYAELDSLFDYRRGLLQWLMTMGIEDSDKRKEEGDRLWKLHAEKTYLARRMDFFDFPGMKLDQRFKELYKLRSVEHWLMYYPTNFGKNFIKTILDIEGFEDKPIGIKSVTLFLNTYPYELTEDLKDELIKHCGTMFKGYVKVKLINTVKEQCDSLYYKQFDYVYRYDILLGEDTQTFMDSLQKNPIPTTCFLVPNILVKETDDITGPISDRIFALSVVVAPSIKIVPIEHSFYDYS